MLDELSYLNCGMARRYLLPKTYHMYSSVISRLTSKHPGPQPPPEISHYDCANGANCTQKNRHRGAH